MQDAVGLGGGFLELIPRDGVARHEQVVAFEALQGQAHW